MMRTFNIRHLLPFLLILCFLYISAFDARCTPDEQRDSVDVMEHLKLAQKNSFKNFVEAQKELALAIEFAQKSGKATLMFKAYRAAGSIYEENSKLEEATEYYKKGLDFSEQIPEGSKLDIFVDWAIINKKAGRYKISRDYYDRTLQFALKIGDTEAAGFAYNGLGTLYGLMGEFDLALNSYLQVIEIARKRKNKRDEVVAMANMASIYTKSNNFDLAYEKITKAQTVALNMNDSSEIANVLNIFGKILNAQKDFKGSLKRHEEALEIYEKIGDKRHILESLIFIADIYTQSGAYSTAEFYFKRCFEYKEYFEYYEHPNLYLKLANLYQKTKRLEEALSAYKKSLELAQNRSFIDIIQKSNLGIAQVYNGLGDYKNAFSYLQTANIYGDSLFNQEKSRRLAEAQYKFDVEKSEKELQALRLTQNKYWLITILVFSSVIILGLVYFLRLKGKNNLILIQKSSEIQFQNEKLEKSNEILRQFAYASAHDLKEPLRSISSFVHIIDRRYSKLLPPEAGEYMNFVVSGVKRMESLLSALLEYSTVASDEQIVKNATSLELVLSDVKHNLHSIIIDKNAIIDADGYLPQVWISRLHLTQLFQNLISNSLKFTDVQPIVKINGYTKGANLIITLKDNGIGMKQEYSDKIFRLFQRLSRNPQYEGTGIGLAICKHIVDKYNGKIWFDSVEGEGTTFFLSFPIKIIQNEQKTEGVDVVHIQSNLLH
jgi:signal transduction histidine kinase